MRRISLMGQLVSIYIKIHVTKIPQQKHKKILQCLSISNSYVINKYTINESNTIQMTKQALRLLRS